MEFSEHPVSSEHADDEPKQEYTWRFWAIIISISITSLLSALDLSVISTAMPSIVNDLGSDYAYIWIANAYFLTMIACQPLYGQTANIFGRRILTLTAVFLFGVGSAVSGSAPNLGALIAGRAIQGIGGGGINILIEIIVADLVPLRERPKFISLIFTAYTVAVVLGPVIGGLLAERVTWRWIFYLNLPISAVSWVLLAFVLRVRYNKATASFKRVDVAGNALLIASVVSVLLALTWGGTQYAWSSWRTLVPLILGLLGMVVFLAVEATTLIPEPTMPFRLFSNRTSVGGFALTFVHSLLSFCPTYFLPVYFQAVLGADAITSGVNLLPLAAVSMPFAIIAGIGVSKFGRYRPWFFLGTSLFAIAFGFFTLLDADSSKAYWVGMQCIVAAGAGILTTTTLPAILAPLPEADQAVTTGTWGFVRSFGSVWGVAIPGAVFNSQVNRLAAKLGDKSVQAMLSNGGAYALASLGGSDSSKSWSPELKVQVRDIYVKSLKQCWQVCIGFSLLAFCIVFVIKEVKLRTHLETEFGLEGETKKLAPETSSVVALQDLGGKGGLAQADAGKAA